MIKINLQFFGGRGGGSGKTGSSSASSSILPQYTMDKMTKSRKDEAMISLMHYTEHNLANRDDKYSLAEVKKYGTVRMYNDKKTNDYIATAYGVHNGVSGYYGVDVRTGKLISSEKAYEIYHKSRA